MEIAEMEIVPVAFCDPPLRNAWGTRDEQAARTIIRLTTKDGLVGISETYGNKDIIDKLAVTRGIVEGMDPHERTQLQLHLQDSKIFGAIETALFDLIGKATGSPIHTLLGGKLRDEVEFSAYLFYKERNSEPETAAIMPQEVLSVEQMVDEASEVVDKHGFDVLKLKGGVFNPSKELDTLESLSEELNDKSFRIDPNGAWSVETAVKQAQRLREMAIELEFLEDPVSSMNAHSRLKDHIDYPIATNMFVTEFEDIPVAIDTSSVDIILSDHHYWGGLTGNLKLDTITRTFDLGIGMHSNSHLGVSMAAMAQVGAAMPSLRYACDTHYPWISDDVILDAPIEISGGTVNVPDDPGLGVELDDDALRTMNQKYENSAASLDGSNRSSSSSLNVSQTINKPIW